MTRPRRTNLARRQKAIETGTAAEIDNNLASRHRRNGERIAAAKTQIGALRHGREFLIGIADVPCLGIQIGSSRRRATGRRRGRRAA